MKKIVILGSGNLSEDIFISRGCAVEIVKDWTDVLTAADRDNPDLIICVVCNDNISSPDENYEFYLRIKNDDRLKNIPVLFLKNHRLIQQELYHKIKETASIMMLEIDERKKIEKQFYQAQKMEAIGRLAGRIAHDFNNYLGAIMGFSELAMQDIGVEHPAYKNLDKILDTACRASNIAKQLLIFSRKQPMEPKIINLHNIIIEMEPILKQLAGKDMELIVKLSSGLKNIKADPCLIEQVIINMVVNARDAMPKGGTLIIETSEHAESILAESFDMMPCHYVVLSFRDTGIGMSKDVKAHIFEPFFTTKESGSGIGLSTVHGIVQQSGGYIKVDTKIDMGTTFDIYFPAVTEKTIEENKTNNNSSHVETDKNKVNC